MAAKFSLPPGWCAEPLQSRQVRAGIHPCAVPTGYSVTWVSSPGELAAENRRPGMSVPPIRQDMRASSQAARKPAPLQGLGAEEPELCIISGPRDSQIYAVHFWRLHGCRKVKWRHRQYWTVRWTDCAQEGSGRTASGPSRQNRNIAATASDFGATGGPLGKSLA